MSRLSRAIRRFRARLLPSLPLRRASTTSVARAEPLSRRPERHNPDYAREVLDTLKGYDFESLRVRFPQSTWHKYLNLEKFVPTSISICKKTGLIGAKPQRILDIGCGTGLFLYCARHFGHDGVGTDIETTMMAEMAKMLGVERHIEAVEAFTPLAIPGTFDLITCMGTQFDHANESKGRKQWGTGEWTYFLRDLERRLTPQGRIFLRINRGQQARADGRRLYDSDLVAALDHGHLHGIAYLFDRDGLSTAISNLAAAGGDADRPTMAAGAGQPEQRSTRA